MLRILLFILYFCFATNSFATNKHNLTGGPYSWEPYQFIQPQASGDVAKGMDIEFAGAIANIIGAHISLEEVKWSNHQGIREGTRDIAFGVTYNP